MGITKFKGENAMKRIIVATMTTLMLCSGAAAYAQTSAAPATSNSTAPTDPRLDISKLKPNQREYLVVALMGQGGVVPEQLAKFKQMYEKMPASQQDTMVEQIAQQIPILPKEMRDKILNNMPPPK